MNEAKFVVVSLPRTGTTSICRMAEMVGMRGKHISYAWRRDLAEFDLFADTPFFSPKVVEELANSKEWDCRFIYLKRSAESWLSSFDRVGLARAFRRYQTLSEAELNSAERFDQPFYVDALGEEALGVEAFERHLRRVREIVQAAGRPWLEYGFEEGWEPFCEFVGKAVPDGPVPHLHQTGVYETKKTAGDLTVVTGIWDIGRDQAGEGFARAWSHYVERFKELLSAQLPMVVHVASKDAGWVREARKGLPTEIVERGPESFAERFDFYERVQEIRTRKEWREQAGWLANSPQATLADYNPMVMSKMFLLHDASIRNPFGSEYFLWLDGAITHTVSRRLLAEERVWDTLKLKMDGFLTVCFPYEGRSEIHGFSSEGMARFADGEVSRVARGGMFGGRRGRLSEANGLYYRILRETLLAGEMGTEENILTLMGYAAPELCRIETIPQNGLLVHFFRQLLKRDVEALTYALSFNHPAQFELLCESFRNHDRFLYESTRKLLINNSTDVAMQEEYGRICNEHGFEQIHQGSNLGICGGRMFAAEHFEQSGERYMFYFEDDMLLHGSSDQPCRNGFARRHPNLARKALRIMEREELDFLKLSFTEFYGDNAEQWAWYNVPAKLRAELFPEQPTRNTTEIGIGPRTAFRHIRCVDGLSYITGEIYYSNWPQVVSREGNRRMFLDRRWRNPHEQTWMSYMYQQTLEGTISGAVLLLSPIEHTRRFSIPRADRKES